jgi:2,3-bisphosphoglycerate-dependent phosphoglycerate mutase
MRLYFIRHGQSENNALWEETGSSRGRSEDPELTRAGHEQAALLAEFLKKQRDAHRSESGNWEPTRDYFGFTHLYTSLMVRSVATGTYVARALDLPLNAWPEIHECGGIFLEEDGDINRVGLPGKPRSYFVEAYAGLVLPETVGEEGWWNRPFEAYEDRPLRARQVLDTLLSRHGNTTDHVAIVSHGGFYMELMRVLFQIENERCWFVMNNTAISRFDFRDDGEVAMIYHNRTDHLPVRLVT